MKVPNLNRTQLLLILAALAAVADQLFGTDLLSSILPLLAGV